MKDIIYLIAQIIAIDIFIGYGLYSILFVIVSIFLKNNKFLNELDKSASRIMIFFGFFYFLLCVLFVFINPPVKLGKYWWGPFAQPLLWIIITQLLWVEKIRKLKIVRLIFAFLFIITFERYVIIATSFNRDFVPSGWGEVCGLTALDIVSGLIIKTSFFILIVYVYYFITKKIKHHE